MDNTSKQNIYDSIESAKQALLKASMNPKLGKYITEDKISEALSNIIVCNSEEEFITQVRLIDPDVKENDTSISGMQAFQAVESKKIVLRNDCDVDKIVHETVHYFSLDGKDTGILGIGNELINDKENPDWNTLNKFHVDVLNEAITHYITQEILPERKVEDAYTYGGIFLRDYAKASENMDKILDTYFAKDKDALDFIAKDINKEGLINWHDIIEVSGVYQYTNMGIFRNFAKNFEKCNTERKRINTLIEKINQRNIERKTDYLQEDDMER
jgi:hypothetical protein